jgi:hypothetical protein
MLERVGETAAAVSLSAEANGIVDQHHVRLTLLI